MKQLNANTTTLHTSASPDAIFAPVQTAIASDYGAYIGLDVHKDTIAIAIAEPGREAPIYEGEIAHTPKKVTRLLTRLSQRYDGEVLQFVYEAGPCGYGLQRQLLASGHEAQVIAPSRIPKAPGERIKTDRRDAVKLARLARSGDLTPVWVPDTEQEAMRDLLIRSINSIKRHIGPLDPESKL